MAVTNEKKSTDSQLSLFDYQLPRAEFSDSPTNTPLPPMEKHKWAVPFREPDTNKTPRFVSLSALCHGLALIAATLIVIPASENLQVEPITIEIADFGPSNLGADELPTQGGGTNLTSNSLDMDQALDEAISQAAATTMPSTPNTDSSFSKMITTSLPAKTVQTKSSSAPLLATPPMMTSMTSPDDIEVPNDRSNAASSAATLPLLPSIQDDLDTDLNKIEAAQKEAQAKKEAAKAAQAERDELERAEQLALIAKAEKAEQQRKAQEQEKLKAEQRAAAAAEKEAALAAASAAAAQKAKQQEEEAQANALLAQQQQPETLSENEGSSLGMSEGPGQGNNGSFQAAEQLAGSPTGIRSLDQLRQMPGNPRPQYDRIERRRGDQGQVAFAAYITKDGIPTQFQILKSTGHRNLDGKTLAALKKWRFHPGQEGWVELPFRWDLKGGVQEDGGLLRRSAQGY